LLGINELKEKIAVTEKTVECPVKGCGELVERQRKVFMREKKFLCPKHKIYISPSTFEYETEQENLLWFDNSDRDLFTKIKKVKRESRIARDNSEDALTWNIFRFLDKHGIIPNLLSQLSSCKSTDAELILWSYSPKQNDSWDLLNKARIEFGETIARGSEPDVIIRTENALYFIEAKLTANNKTKPSNNANRKKYETGGNNLFQKIFSSDYETIAITGEKYELMRFWLLGTWIAKQLNLDFYLVSLVPSENEKNIESIFRNYIVDDKKELFIRLTWERIYEKIKNINITGVDKDKIINYFNNKTIGFDGNGKLQKAFSI
jgi:hypothetical protein